MSSNAEYLAALSERFPGTTIIEPQCGPQSTYLVLKQFDVDAEPLDAISLSLGVTGSSASTDLKTIKEYIENQGLHVLPVKGSLADLYEAFDPFCAILNTGRRYLQDVEGPGSHTNEDHFLVLIRRGENSTVLDAPDTFGLSGFDDVGAFGESVSYHGVALVIADRPLELPTTGSPLLSPGILTFAILGIVVAMIALRRISRFAS